ncbi:MAG: alpha amylase C-terminal domain-containing protein, partial [Chloroflexales bacterium]|nr:alpha amylase C-terminal domain-containing protein [Chloroflexales bacterium]
LDWHLLEFPSHQGVQRLMADLNRIYRAEPALHALDFDPAGFEWIDANDADSSTYCFMRKCHKTNDIILFVCNCTPVLRLDYRIGVPRGGYWRELLNSDGREYWGSGQGNSGGVEATPMPSHRHPCSLKLTLPPLGAIFFKSEG